jgi:hypothetical protein
MISVDWTAHHVRVPSHGFEFELDGYGAAPDGEVRAGSAWTSFERHELLIESTTRSEFSQAAMIARTRSKYSTCNWRMRARSAFEIANRLYEKILEIEGGCYTTLVPSRIERYDCSLSDDEILAAAASM